MLTIENSRSGDEMLRALAKYGYSRDIGAGVYDVHSPVVPPCAPLLFIISPQTLQHVTSRLNSQMQHHVHYG